MKYTLAVGDLTYGLSVPRPEASQHYDRLTGCSNAGALALATHVIEERIPNDVHMHLMARCNLRAPGGEAMRQRPPSASGRSNGLDSSLAIPPLR